MNDIFRRMAEQMKPAPQLREDLESRLDAIDELAKPRPVAVERAVAPAPPRRRALAWVATAACVAAAASAGVWAIGNQSEAHPASAAAGGGAATVMASPLQEPVVVPVTEYGELYQAVTTALTRHQGSATFPEPELTLPKGRARGDVVATTNSLGAASTETGGELQGQFSGTNVQVAGIDEGDVVKTDGRVLYVATGTRVAILTPDGAATREVASIDTAAKDAPVAGAVLDMMLSGDRLVVFVQDYASNTKAIGGNQPTAYVAYDVTATRAVLYDVADPAHPKQVASLGQSGSYRTSRLSDGVLYLVTDYSLTDPAKVDKDAPGTYVPQVIDGVRPVPLPPGDIHALKYPQEPRYAVATAVDVASGKRLGEQAVLAGADTTYMSQDNLYLAARLWDAKLSATQREAAGVGDLNGGATTTIVRIALNGGALALGAQKSVPGSLLNQFALDEHDGHLRVVTDMTGDYDGRWIRRVALFVLDDKLAIVGKLPKLVENESVQSARFDGEVGYVVTFRQRDPLFAIDLSVPAKPKVMSALKIPGFSAYLHPWADGRLLGVGVDAKNDGSQTGLKLSMFDTSDPYAVKELTNEHVAGGDSEALRDHKAVLVDTERGLIGFPVATWTNSEPWTKMEYKVYSYSPEKGFALAKSLKMDVAEVTRGVLVGDFLYLCTDKSVDVFSLDSFAKATSVKVK